MAKEIGVTVVLVTHDNRILDIADRIVSLVDGVLVSNGKERIPYAFRASFALFTYKLKSGLPCQTSPLLPKGFGAISVHAPLNLSMLKKILGGL